MKSIKITGTLLLLLLLLSSCGRNDKVAESQNNGVTGSAIQKQTSENQFVDFSFKANDTGISITKYAGQEKALAIPAEIEGKPVTQISRYTFSNNNQLESVVIPENVTIIEDYAFCLCRNLKSVQILSKQASFGVDSFSLCNSISDFQNNSEVKNVLFIGNSLTNQGNLPTHFADIAAKKGKKVNTWKETKSGAKLEDHWKEDTMSTLKNKIKLADIVILQEYGGVNQTGENKEVIKQMLSFCNKNAKTYMLITQFDMGSENLLDGWCGIKLIPTGDLLDHIISSNYFKHNQLIASDSIHPTTFYGFFSSLLIYDTVMNDTCSDLQGRDYLSTNFTSFLNGEDENSVNDKISKIENYIDIVSKK